ncbi:TetR family transcriptional regulator [Nakamurella sp. YIM 132087]|uniref:TetR family transcriptional regulator n=1 Tax=Nakamurella alba TaxID=2665158 RepID=A0A7K1FEC9_9ACTN|nr:TetR/AcrR family transcriptional regulator [Nakamurella alba]MTD12462.1 TetR family transcriptional regulator [Nakamurella alba]
MPRDRRILDAAAEVFFEKGFGGAGVDEIGRRAGLSGPAIYRHFTGKDEILAALFDEAIDELDRATGATGEVNDGPPQAPRLRLETLLRHHVDYAVRRRQLVNIYQREDRNLVDPWRQTFTRRRRAYIGRWEAVVAAAAPGRDPQEIAVLTQAVLGTAFSVAFWPAAVVRLGDPADRLVSFVWSGLDGPGLTG